MAAFTLQNVERSQRSRWLLVFVVACSSEARTVDTPPTITSAPPDVRAVDAAVAHSDATGDARSLDTLLAELRGRGMGDAAAAIERRATQRAPKMRLDDAQARAAAIAVLAVAEREPMRALHRVMPRSLVEIARAVAERGVAIEEADAIAAYLVRVVGALDFERVGVFDENHSHVTGREWHEIDYSGEGMTWHGQRDDWTPKGVVDFKRVRHLHAYFVGAEKLPHWKRVYRPRGSMREVVAPPPR